MTAAVAAVAVPRPRLRRLPIAGAGAALLALGLALVVGPGGTPVPSIVCGVLAIGLLLAEVGRRSLELLRSGRGLQIGLGLLGSAIVSVAWSIAVAFHVEFLAISVAFGLAGVSLVSLALIRIRADLQAGQTPWQALTGAPSSAAAARSQFRRLAPLLAGVLLMLLSLRALATVLTDLVDTSADGAVFLAFVMLAVFVLGPAWALRGVVGRTAASRGRPAVARDEQVVAAHLHDSVLQTLSLIQRNAGDPARVAQLARQQERSLRAWLAGRDDTAGSTLAAAVRLVAQEVEDEQPGAVIEVVAVGDAPLDREADAMVRAAREALRNAVRHAGSPVRVFLEVEDGVRELFVRDTGPGFDLDLVADERRGVRDAIIGRMEHVGGTATIDSGPAGTEIALRLPPPTAGGAGRR